ncbi:hypothetical protein [Pseudarthrobacter siccitolerans]
MTERMIGPALAIDPPSPEFAESLRRGQEMRQRVDHPDFLDGPEHVITGSRQEGKTRLALKWLTEAPEGTERVLVVTDQNQAEHMNADLGWAKNDPRIIGFRRLINQGARKGVQYGIDESVRILSDLLGLKEAPRLITVGHAAPWQTGKPPLLKPSGLLLREILGRAENGSRVALFAESLVVAQSYLDDIKAFWDESLVEKVSRVHGKYAITFRSGGFLDFRSFRAPGRARTYDRVYVPANARHDVMLELATIVDGSTDPEAIVSYG